MKLKIKDFKLKDGKYIIKKINDKPGLLLIYAPWCGYSKLILPEWDDFKKKYSKKYYIASLNVEEKNSGNKLISKKLGITGYPTIKYVNKDGIVGVNYDGERDIESFTKYLAEK